jgi:mono/diheme cytochrome c family protein
MNTELLSRPSLKLATLALAASLGAAHAQQPASAPRDPAQIFATTCGWCHHKGGREAGKGPQLMGTTLTDSQIEYRIKRGRQGFMPGFEGAFSEEEIQGLVGYIRNLKAK